jgi:hypothetical protein
MRRAEVFGLGNKATSALSSKSTFFSRLEAKSGDDAVVLISPGEAI